jgi:PTH1 family peptidyl-tRNA hydrolase
MFLLKNIVFKFSLFKKITMNICLIGLGNTKKFKDTRHNIGYDFVEWFAKKNNISLGLKKNVLLGSLNKDHSNIHCCLSQTFMNTTGEIIPQIKDLLNKEGYIIIIHDDLQMEFGEIKLRINKDRGPRGHNGSRSIIEHLKINNIIDQKPFFLSVGIGRPANKEDVGDYVLQKFNAYEQSQLQNIFLNIEKNILDFITKK